MNPYGVLAGSIGLIAIGLLIFRKVRADYRREGKLTPYSVFLEFLIFSLHGCASYLFLDSNLKNVRVTSLTFVVGTSCMVVGLAGVVGAMARLNWRKSIGRNTSGLQHTGLYRYTRNPQIVAYGLLVLGYALWWPSWSGLLWVLVYAAIGHVMVLTEEEHLRNVYGEAYDDYCSRTPRYLGLLPKATADDASNRAAGR